MSSSNSIKDSSNHEGFIIESRFGPIEYFTNLHRIIDRSKIQAIHDIIQGTEFVPTKEQINRLNYSQLHFFQAELNLQTLELEATLKASLLEEIKSNPLHAYKYKVPIIAFDPLHPTQLELDNSRQRIPYPEYAYKRYLTSINDTLIQPGARNVNAVQRARQYRATRPSPQYFGYGSDNPAEVIEAENTEFIQQSEWPILVSAEVAIHPSIVRLVPEDTVESISLKLTQDRCTKAAEKYNSSHKLYEQESSRVKALHGKLKEFFVQAIEGVEVSKASIYIDACEWNLVLPSITESYGHVLSPNSLNDIQQKFNSLTLASDETVHMFLKKMRESITNIQIISEKTEEVANKLSYPEVFGSCFLTDEEFSTKFPHRKRFITHLTTLNQIIVAIKGTRLSKVSYDFNVNVIGNQNRTIARLIAMMEVGETALDSSDQVLHAISSIATSSINPNRDSVPRFCAYHSYDGQISYHSTSKCKLIKEGKTKPDPTNSTWHVYKSTGLHYVPYNSGGASSSKKRPLADEPSRGTKEAKVTPAPLGKSCTSCLKMNREGAAIPESIMKNHAAPDCRVNPKRHQNPAANSSTSSVSKDNSKSNSKATTKLLKAINSLNASLNPDPKKKKDKSKKSAVESDASDAEE